MRRLETTEGEAGWSDRPTHRFVAFLGAITAVWALAGWVTLSGVFVILEGEVAMGAAMVLGGLFGMTTLGAYATSR